VQYTVAQAAQTLTFAQQGSLTKTYGDDAFSNAASNNCRDGGSITYASSRESVATVASDGTVTIHAGEATITATAAETANYQQSAASYTLRVSPKGVTITGLQVESKTYDGTAAAVITGTPALSGLMAGDDVTVDASRAAAAFADADAGTGKTVLLSGYALTGADAANYTLIAQPTGITADITKAAITVTPDAAKAVQEAKAGKVEYRLDKTNIIHCPIGKVSFGSEKLFENYSALIGAIIKAKPAAAKGQYIKSCVAASTMGPGVKMNANKQL
jgi:hypothetical protein